MPKKTQMTDRIYEYLQTVIPQQGYAPSVREICQAVGLKSPSTVHFHLKRLQERGLIEKGDGKGRAIVLTGPQDRDDAPRGDKIPILGDVAAGAPILAQECIDDYLTFDCGGRAEEFFALRVRGESMLYAGILPGDYVVVHQQESFRNGDIVGITIVTSGGQGSNEPTSEARCMADYLMEGGVPEDQILLEDQSHNTKENFLYSKELLADEGIDVGETDVLVVSNGFHLTRARMLAERGERPDVIVLDPPRKGCSPDLVRTVAEFGPKRIVYVSCDPATLARDLKLFAALGYAPVKATPVDMFPGTSHVETVALLVRQEG